MARRSFEPHASGIIAKVNAVTGEKYPAGSANEQGHITSVGD